MCLFIIGKTKPNSIIADKDIHCYKIFSLSNDCSIRTEYQHFPMEVGKRYKDEKQVPLLTVNGGGGWIVGEGMFHSFAAVSGAVMESVYRYNTIAFHCIIPKGAVYYEGAFNGYKSYASNEIIITDKVAYYEDIVNWIDNDLNKGDKESCKILFNTEIILREEVIKRYNIPLNEEGYIDNDKCKNLSLEEINV